MRPSRTRTASRIFPLLGILCTVGCSDLVVVAANTCGNNVLETGETCDHPGAGCGKDGPAACRYTCDPAGAGTSTGCEDPRYTCGHDGVCRLAAPTYTFSDVYGTAGDRLEVLDFDDDGVMDLVDRGSRKVTLFQNDGHGALSVYASANVSPDESIVRAFAAGKLATDDAAPILATLSTYTLDLSSITKSHTIEPLVFAANLLPAGVDARFVGGVHFESDAASTALYYDPAGPSLLTAVTSNMPVSHSFDLSACGATAHGTVDGSTTDRFDGRSMAALILDGSKPCVAAASLSEGAPEIDLTPLPVAALTAFAPGYTLQSPILLNIDGDGVPDMAAVLSAMLPSTCAPDSALTLYQYLVTWRYDSAKSAYAEGRISPEPGCPNAANYPTSLSIYDVPTALVAADYNGDGLDDIAEFYELWLNGGAASGFKFADDSLSIDSTVYDYSPGLATGDVNGDGFIDLVLAGSNPADLLSCTSSGAAASPRFICFSVVTGLGSVSAITLADVNGDQILDAVAVGALGVSPSEAVADGGAGATDNPPAGRVAISFGRYHTFPDPTAQTLEAYRGSPIGVIRSAQSPNIDPTILLTTADDLLVALDLGGRAGVAEAHAVPGNLPAFGLPYFSFDAEIVGGRMYSLRCDPVDGYYTDCKVQVHSGGDGAAFASTDQRHFSQLFDPAQYTGYGALLRFGKLPDDALPSTLWVEKAGVFVGRIGDTTIDVKQIASPVMFAYPSALTVLDVDGAKDPAGDHRNEILITEVDTSTSVCQVLVGRVGASGALPSSLTLAATVQNCRYGSSSSFDASFGVGTPFVVRRPSDVHGGSLMMTVTGSDGKSHLASLPPVGDDTYGAPTLDPALFHLHGAAAGAAPVALVNAADYLYSAEADMNGDGVPDLVFSTPQGAVIAFADSTP